MSAKEGTDGLMVAEVDLSCPVCYDLCICAQGSNCGHLCCKRCTNMTKGCPSCRNPKPDWTPNHYINRIVRSMSRPCRYEYCGCKFSGSQAEVMEHAQKCTYKPTKVVTTLKKHSKPGAVRRTAPRIIARNLMD